MVVKEAFKAGAAALAQAREKAGKLAHNAHVLASHEMLYAGYFVSAAAEGHGLYSALAGVLAVYVVLDLVAGGEA